MDILPVPLGIVRVIIFSVTINWLGADAHHNSARC